jgi:hypothetical protein
LAITHGARVIDSTPPATTTSALPDSTACAALEIAVRPEAHSRFTVYAGCAAAAGQQHRHARDVAVVLARLVGRAENDLVDPVRVQAGRADRLPDDESARSSARTPASAPPYRPTGVRTPPTRNASAMARTLRRNRAGGLASDGQG